MTETPNAAAINEWTPIHAASAFGFLDIVKFLVPLVTDPYSRNGLHTTWFIPNKLLIIDINIRPYHYSFYFAYRIGTFTTPVLIITPLLANLNATPLFLPKSPLFEQIILKIN